MVVLFGAAFLIRLLPPDSTLCLEEEGVQVLLRSHLQVWTTVWVVSTLFDDVSYILNRGSYCIVVNIILKIMAAERLGCSFGIFLLVLFYKLTVRV